MVRSRLSASSMTCLIVALLATGCAGSTATGTLVKGAEIDLAATGHPKLKYGDKEFAIDWNGRRVELLGVSAPVAFSSVEGDLLLIAYKEGMDAPVTVERGGLVTAGGKAFGPSSALVRLRWDKGTWVPDQVVRRDGSPEGSK